MKGTVSAQYMKEILHPPPNHSGIFSSLNHSVRFLSDLLPEETSVDKYSWGFMPGWLWWGFFGGGWFGLGFTVLVFYLW